VDEINNFDIPRLSEFIAQDGDLVLEAIEFAPHPVHKVPTYFFRMVHAVSKKPIGQINLRVGCSAHIRLYAGHIGYSVDVLHRGNRYASRALRSLAPLARDLGLGTLCITCDPENIASRRTCELAGATLVEIVDVPETCIIRRTGHPRKCRYLLTL
jgi:predicted acetyltransferase